GAGVGRLATGETSKHGQPGRVDVGFEFPDGPARKIVQERAIVSHIAGPDDRCRVDVGAVVDPFFEREVPFLVVNDHQVFTTVVGQLGGDGLPVVLPTCPFVGDVGVRGASHQDSLPGYQHR